MYSGHSSILEVDVTWGCLIFRQAMFIACCRSSHIFGFIIAVPKTDFQLPRWIITCSHLKELVFIVKIPVFMECNTV
jgi:hypothetical protein